MNIFLSILKTKCGYWPCGGRATTQRSFLLLCTCPWGPPSTSSGSWAQLTGVPEEAVQQHAQEAPIGSPTQGVDGLWWKRWKLMPKILNLWFFLKYVYFSVYAQSFFPINLAPIFPTSNWNFELLECHRAIIFFAAVIYMFCHCAYEISWPSMKNCGPDRAAKFIFFRWKAIFRYTTFESCRDHNFSSIGSRNFVCTISIHIPTHSKKKML